MDDLLSLRLTQPALPLMLWLIALPLVGAALTAVLPERHARVISAIGMGGTLSVALVMVLCFIPGGGFQYLIVHPWIPSLGAHLRLGVDALSVVLLPLSALMFGGALIDLWRRSIANTRLFFSLLQLQLALTLGILCALDSLLFFAFWEASLLPLYGMVVLWGETQGTAHFSPRRAATQYVLLMLGSGALLLLALLWAAQRGAGFDLTSTGAVPTELSIPIFLLLLAGLAAKLPVVPLHTWLPRLALGSPAGVVATFGGLKLGVYALIRLGDALTPTAWAQMHWLLAGIGTIGILYGAVAAVVQTNLRTLLAYLGISHVGLILLGLASGDAAGRQGAILLLWSLHITAGGLYLLFAALHRRTGSTELLHNGGVFAAAPKLTALTLWLALASIGLPGLIAFPAELLIIASSLKTHTGAALAAIFGAAVGAAALLGALRTAFFGTSPMGASLPDLRFREFALFLLLAASALAMGLFPAALTHLLPVF